MLELHVSVRCSIKDVEDSIRSGSGTHTGFSPIASIAFTVPRRTFHEENWPIGLQFLRECIVYSHETHFIHRLYKKNKISKLSCPFPKGTHDGR